jgi:hypothetical protein
VFEIAQTSAGLRAQALGGSNSQVLSMDSHGPERMVEIVTALSVLGDVLSDLIGQARLSDRG